jgi:nucleotide-binding universal stress UspA family protein
MTTQTTASTTTRHSHRGHTHTAAVRSAPQRSPAAAREPTLVVGYDGSPEARTALAAARSRAGADGRLIVVHVTRQPSSWLGRSSYDRVVAERLHAGDMVLRELGGSIDGDDHLELELMMDRSPAEALRRVAAVRDADEIVVGSRRLGRLRSALGSVSQAVMRAADRPVLVVPASAAVH